MGREALLGEQSPLSPYLPAAANAPAPGRQERALGGRGSARDGAPTAPRPPRPRHQHRHRHGPAGEAKTSRLLEMTLPASLHTPSSLQRQIKRNPCGGESLREGQGAWAEEAQSWGRCQSVAGHQSLGVSKRGQPPKWYPAPAGCAASDPAPSRGRDRQHPTRSRVPLSP